MILKAQLLKNKQRQHCLWLLEFIRLSVPLVKNIQQHRAMSLVYLNGDKSMQSKVLTKQGHVDSAVLAFSQLYQSKNTPSQFAESEHLINSWKQLKSSVFQLQPASSFSQHAQLVTEILLNIEKTCHSKGLKASLDFSDALFLALTKSVPLLTEVLGQSRGIGMVIASQGGGSISNHVKIKHLYQQCQTIVSETLDVLVAEEGAEYLRCRETIDQFLIFLKAEILEKEQIEVKPDDYFQQATEAIDQTFWLIDVLIRQAKRSL